MVITPVFFPDARAFRAWLRQHHRTGTEIVLRLAKAHVAHTGVTYGQALDEALCYGWIDGIRRGLDADTFTVRFTPRRPSSRWSQVNVRHAERLIQQKRMTRAGLAAFGTPATRPLYAHQGDEHHLTAAVERRLRTNRRAWRYFADETPSYRRGCLAWLADAKRAETRDKRLRVLIECSARGVRIPGYPARRRETASGRTAVAP